MSNINYSKLYGFDYHLETIEYAKKLIENKLPELAKKTLLELIEVFPGSFEAHLELAIAYSNNLEYEKSINTYKRLFELNPQHVRGHIEFANTLIKCSKSNLGLDYFEKVIKFFPKNDKLFYLYGKLFYHSNQIENAFSKITKAIELNNLESEYFLLQAKIGVKLGNNSLILDSLQHSINNLKEENSYIFVEISELLSELGDANTAIGLIEQNLKRFRISDEYLAKIANILIKNNLKNEAINLLDSIVSSLGGTECQKILSSLTNKNEPVISNRVVFVCATPRARESKFGWALRKKGWEVILLYSELPDFNLENFFDEMYQYNNPEHALMLAEKMNPKICHVFHTFADKTSITFVKEKIRPTIFDTNDIFEGTINEGFSVIPAQRFAIENADGLCCRDLQIAHACNSLNYKRRKVVIMQDYCWNSSEIFNAEINNKVWNEEISIAAVGNFPIEKKTGKIGFLKISEQIASQNIHFHIYPHWFFSKIPHEEFVDNFSEYLELQERNPYFQIRKPVPMNDLIKTIATYDFGVGSTAEILLGLTPERSPAHFYFGGSGRNMDYIDALLPTISTKNTYLQYRRLKQYGLAIEGNPEFMKNSRQILTDYKNNFSTEKLIEAREKEGVMNHIDKLIKFYNSL